MSVVVWMFLKMFIVGYEVRGGGLGSGGRDGDDVQVQKTCTGL